MKPPFIDTNVLIYAFSDDPRCAKAQECLARPFLLSVQALNEFSSVALRKLGMSVSDVRSAISDICFLAEDVLPLDREAHSRALDIVERYGLSFYDSLMLATACRAGCDIFLSEDMRSGLRIDDGPLIVNPFA
jgi:predicted nucleic acid-binding protein